MKKMFLGVFLALCGALYAAEPQTIKWNLGDFRNEAAKSGLLDFSVADGVGKVVMSRAEKNPGAISFPVPAELNAETNNTLLIRLKADANAQKYLIRIRCFLYGSTGWGWDLVRPKLQPDGTLLATWDIANRPPLGNYGFSPRSFQKLAFAFDHSEVPAGEKITFSIVGIESVAGYISQDGDPALFARWNQFKKSYQTRSTVDFSALEAPRSGRIARPYALVEKGKALGQIVIPSAATAPEKRAAAELVLWIDKITGAKLPIVTEAQSGSPSILLKTLPGDKFHGAWKISTEGNRTTISGIGDRGVVAGAIAFLENNSDLLFARPQRDFGTIFTKRPDFTVIWGEGEFSPKSKYFGWQPDYGGGAVWIPDWSLRNHNNYLGAANPDSGFRTEFGGGHNLQTFLPRGDKAFFPVVGGAKPDKLSIWKHQICMSAPNLIPVYSANVQKYFEEKAPAGTAVMNIKIEDNWGVCECEKCTAPIRLEDGTMLPSTDPAFRSTQFFLFLNAVTRELQKKHPGLQVQTYAYFFTAVPPKCKVDPQIWILFCPYIRPDHRNPLCAPINDRWWKAFEGWRKATPNVILREYYGIFNNGRPLAETVAFDLRSYAERGVRSMAPELFSDGLTIQSGGAFVGAESEWDHNMMEFWLINRLYLDPEQDIEQLRNYFLTRAFHAAAPEMAEYYAILRRSYYAQAGQSDWGNFRRMVEATGKSAELRALLDKAVAKADNPISALLCARIRQSFDDFMAERKTDVKKLSLNERLCYGFGTGVRSASETYLTTLWDGKTLTHPLRFIARKHNGADLQFGVSFPKENLKKTISFRLSPGLNYGDRPHPQARLVVASGMQFDVPESAWVRETDGSFRFSWKLKAGFGAKDPNSRFLLRIPKEQLPEEGGFEFDLTELEIK